MLHLLPDLGAGGALVRERIRGIAELVDIERARDLRGESLRHVLIIIGMALGDVGARHANLGAQRLEMQYFFCRHLVRDDQQHAIAFGARDQGESEAGVACSRLDHGPAGFESTVLLGGSDHRQGDAVLDRAPWVLVLELEE